MLFYKGFGSEDTSLCAFLSFPHILLAFNSNGWFFCVRDEVASLLCSHPFAEGDSEGVHLAWWRLQCSDTKLSTALCRALAPQAQHRQQEETGATSMLTNKLNMNDCPDCSSRLFLTDNHSPRAQETSADIGRHTSINLSDIL